MLNDKHISYFINVLSCVFIVGKPLMHSQSAGRIVLFGSPSLRRPVAADGFDGAATNLRTHETQRITAARQEGQDEKRRLHCLQIYYTFFSN